MLNRLKALVRRGADGAVKAEISQLRDQVTMLKQELDEYRQQSLHVAEMIDLVEQRLTTQNSVTPNE